jgi:RNA polymerase sigma-70 factor (ECF subfamily)
MEDPRLDGMRTAITRLPETHREVLEMRLADELSYAQIAEAMDLPIGTVRSRIHHAILRLRMWASEDQTAARSGNASPSRGPAGIPAERKKR